MDSSETEQPQSLAPELSNQEQEEQPATCDSVAQHRQDKEEESTSTTTTATTPTTTTTTTTAVASGTTLPMEQVVQEQEPLNNPLECPDFCMGDHVYRWCSFLGVPAVCSHHGIVLDVYYCPTAQTWRLCVVDFTHSKDQTIPQPTNQSMDPSMDSNHDNSDPSFNHSSHSPSFNTKKGSGMIRTYETDPKLWKKVVYEAGFWQKHLARGGTATGAKADPPGMVRARVQFLLDGTTKHKGDSQPHQNRLPAYHVVQSNSECFAVWCKTGTWATLQATSWLSAAAAGQIKSTATLVGAAASTTVTVPAAGMWGWFGYTTQVSLLSTQPWLVPALAAYGIVSVGGPTLWLAMAHIHCKKITQNLNTAFWEAAVENPDVFSEYLTYWSSLPCEADQTTAVPLSTTAATAIPPTPTTIKPPSPDVQLPATVVPQLPTSAMPARVLPQLPTSAMEKLSLSVDTSDTKDDCTRVSETVQGPCQEAVEG